MKTLTLYLTVLIGLSVSAIASGVPVDNGLTTIDPDTGLEWLDMSESTGVSAASIINGTDPDGLGAEGWIHASLEQLRTLLINAGLTEPFDGTQSPGNLSGADLLIGLLGPTGSYQTSVFIQSFVSDEDPSNGYLYTPVVITSFGTVGGADLPGPSVPASVTNSTIGNYLVRPASIPEPVTLALMGLGLAGIGYQRRKQIKAA